MLVVEDHAALRRALVATLGAAEGIEVVGESGDGLDAVERAGRLVPDVVVMDLVLPGIDGIEATRRIAPSGVAVLALSMHGDRRLVEETLAAGARGYVVKDGAADELVGAIHAVAAGGTYLSPALGG